MADLIMHRDAVLLPPGAANRFAARVRRRAIRAVWLIVLIAVVLVVAAWSVTAVALWHDYNVALRRGAWVGANLAGAFAVELTQTLDSADQVFRAAQAALPVTPDKDMSPVRAALRQTKAAIGDPDAVLIVFGADGRRVAAFGRVPAGLDEAAAPDDTAAGDLQVGSPVPDAPANWLPIRRTLRASDGAVAGQAELLLNAAHLLRLSRSGGISPDGQVFITNNDGIVEAGYGPGEADGKLQAGSSVRAPGYPDHLPAGQAVSYRQRDADGLERLVTVRQLAYAPLRIVVTRDLDEIVWHVRQQFWFFAFGRTLATIIIGTLTFLLIKEVFKRSRREIELVHERARLAGARRQINADRARLEAIDSELKASQRDLDAANHVRTQFLAHMSHELRTPLHAIIGFAELIRDQAPALPGHTSIQGYATDIWSSGRHLLALINSILDIAKVDSGTVTLREEWVGVASLMNDSLTAVRGQAAARSVTLDVVLPDPVLAVAGDPTRLLQVLINLLSNAVKFTPRGGRIQYGAARGPGGELALSVADTGIGMTEAEIDIALQPFGQVDNTTARRFDGTGLGLPIARRLTELHGGRLDIVSVKGGGTTVTVTLPAERVRNGLEADTGGLPGPPVCAQGCQGGEACGCAQGRQQGAACGCARSQ